MASETGLGLPVVGRPLLDPRLRLPLDPGRTSPRRVGVCSALDFEKAVEREEIVSEVAEAVGPKSA